MLYYTEKGVVDDILSVIIFMLNHVFELLGKHRVFVLFWLICPDQSGLCFYATCPLMELTL